MFSLAQHFYYKLVDYLLYTCSGMEHLKVKISILVLTSYPHILLRGHFPSRFPTTTLHATLLSHVSAT